MFIGEAPPLDMRFALGNVVIEWNFRVPLAEFRGFISFLADNEAMIAASCERLMKGVHYRGTFLTTDDGRPEFRTYWAYDTHDAEKQWEAGLANRNSNFVRAVQRLRSYWLKDAQASQRHMAAGALLGDKVLGPFFKLTLDTAEEIAGGRSRRAAAGRKARRK
jgi:hypothetical protein